MLAFMKSYIWQVEKKRADNTAGKGVLMLLFSVVSITVKLCIFPSNILSCAEFISENVSWSTDAEVWKKPDNLQFLLYSPIFLS